ncbi:hypothetical protein IV203_032669 [Nitzschia inconspicua]|uniref:Uncharacterized protein n=1 Tax=Nitzschia inconspicua TaxID=303405 RepID=A0A9K3KLT5_9STRA|nr:hypothetical protein IV203_032669 [Nitzschia inconspicua]
MLDLSKGLFILASAGIFRPSTAFHVLHQASSSLMTRDLAPVNSLNTITPFPQLSQQIGLYTSHLWTASAADPWTNPATEFFKSAIFYLPIFLVSFILLLVLIPVGVLWIYFAFMMKGWEYDHEFLQEARAYLEALDDDEDAINVERGLSLMDKTPLKNFFRLAQSIEFPDEKLAFGISIVVSDILEEVDEKQEKSLNTPIGKFTVQSGEEAEKSFSEGKIYKTPFGEISVKNVEKKSQDKDG